MFSILSKAPGQCPSREVQPTWRLALMWLWVIASGFHLVACSVPGVCADFSIIGLLTKQVKATITAIKAYARPNPNWSMRRPADMEPINIPRVRAVLKTPIVAPMPKDRPPSIAKAEVVGKNKASPTPIRRNRIITCQTSVEKPSKETMPATLNTEIIVSITRL